MDPDHLDIYGTAEEVRHSFNAFARNIKPAGQLVIRDGMSVILKPGIRRIDYAVEEISDYFAINLRTEEGYQVFDLVSSGLQWKGLRLQVPGKHNIENTLAAIAVCRVLNTKEKDIADGIESFTGVRRRFDIRVRKPEVVYIDDYAHHPRELNAFITAVRQLFPGKKLTGLFQPHLYSRTRDFAAGFAESLDLLDEAWLLDIYPARELPVPGVDSAMILGLMTLPERKLLSKEQVLELVAHKKPEIFLTIGAGDIDMLVEPITKLLQS
jgi:UDP-N-acetylmuramate--alanine ligase